MHSHRTRDLTHDHAFLGDRHHSNERRTRIVIALTCAMMVAEIAAGLGFGSMALLADGMHMATHAGALALAAAAYAYARRHLHNPAYAFGTGKVGDLAGFTSALMLGGFALMIGWESLGRLAAPVAIDFDDAIMVAALGLVVNLASAWLLHGGDGADHHHVASHHHDHNHEAAYFHVLADAFTSVLAIGGLLAGRHLGWHWMDPAVGLLGAAVIARWAYGLMKRSAAVLLDASNQDLASRIRSAIGRRGDHVTDLHVWSVGPGHHAAVLSVMTAGAASPHTYRSMLEAIPGVCHVTVEVHAPAAPR